MNLSDEIIKLPVSAVLSQRLSKSSMNECQTVTDRLTDERSGEEH